MDPSAEKTQIDKIFMNYDYNKEEKLNVLRVKVDSNVPFCL